MDLRQPKAMEARVPPDWKRRSLVSQRASTQRATRTRSQQARKAPCAGQGERWEQAEEEPQRPGSEMTAMDEATRRNR
jgi:hypothetical protein